MLRPTFLGTLTGGLVAASLAAGGEGPPDWDPNRQLCILLLVLGLPTIFGLTIFAEAGGLMAYGANRNEMWRHLVINLR